MGTGETHTCGGCFVDSVIKDHIQWEGIVGRCSFCGARDVQVLDIVELAAFIDKGIEQKYEDAAESVSFESAEGGYQMDTLSAADILLFEESVFDEERLSSPEKLAKALDGASKYSTVPLVRRNPYGEASGDSRYMSIWERFCERLRHMSRFMMFRTYVQHAQARMKGEMPPGVPGTEEFEFNELWYQIDSFVYELIGDIATDELVYRARLARPEDVYEHADLTSPPVRYARDSRMSARGIAYFYGGLEAETCLAEVRPYVGARVAVAEFRTTSGIYVLDLTKIPEPASIFDLENYYFERDEFALPFLQTFAEHVSRPISPDDGALEYLPTQAFCEFLQTIQHTFPIQGLKYGSAMRKGGNCVALFKDQTISIGPKPWLVYQGIEYRRVDSVAYESSKWEDPTDVEG